MKKLLFVFAMALTIIGSGAGLFALAQNPARNAGKEEGMAYCTVADLQGTYGEDRINGWSRLDPDVADKAIANASAEIDGYLLSAGLSVPLAGTPATIKKYCVDIASASLVISAGVLDSDPGGKAVIEQAEIARRYLDKVAQGKYRIPGYDTGGGDAAVTSPPSGNIQARTMNRLDLRGY
jgi:phage gp36-like protein